MKLRPDQERVSSLLRETITLMCKNGLSFENQFCIEATIGITLDDKDVFVMSLNEVVGRDGLSADESPPEEESPTTQKRPAKRLRRKRTVSPKKTPIKKLSEDSWGEEEYEDFPSDSSPPAKRPTPDLDLNMSCEEEGKKVIVKQEHEAQPHSSLSFDDQPTGEAAGDDSLELEGSVDEQQPSVSNAQIPGKKHKGTPRSSYRQYSQEALEAAMAAVEGGMSKKGAAKTFGVPKTTLLDKLDGTSTVNSALGRPGLLTPSEEHLLVEYITLQAETGFPISKAQLAQEVANVIRMDGRANLFKDSLPGPDWVRGFLRRHHSELPKEYISSQKHSNPDQNQTSF